MDSTAKELGARIISPERPGIGLSTFQKNRTFLDWGKDINELYLKECGEIIKRNIGILSGDIETLKLNTEIVLKKKELLKTNEKIKNKTYTLEYEIFDCDAYEEFSSLEELNYFLNKQNDILKYRILDWNMDVIKKP